MCFRRYSNSNSLKRNLHHNKLNGVHLHLKRCKE